MGNAIRYHLERLVARALRKVSLWSQSKAEELEEKSLRDWFKSPFFEPEPEDSGVAWEVRETPEARAMREDYISFTSQERPTKSDLPVPLKGSAEERRRKARQ